MTEFVADLVVPAALALLPRNLDTLEARAMLLAMGLQESAFLYRRQRTNYPTYAPARGFWQFELGGGVLGVLTHSQTRAIAERVLRELRYAPAANATYEALEHNDVLACCFARLLLLQCPRENPGPGEALDAWRVYVTTWRPGAFKDWREGDPMPERWGQHYADAWRLVKR